MHHVKPKVIYSGDDHDYCEYWHPNGVKEVTVKAFSMASGIDRPGFQLLSLTPPPQDPALEELPHTTFADDPCFLPDQTQIYHSRYLPLVLLTVLVLFWINLRAAINRHGGWRAGFAQAGGKVAQALSPNLSRSPSFSNFPQPEQHSKGSGGRGSNPGSRRSSGHGYLSPNSIEKTMSSSRQRPANLAPIPSIASTWTNQKLNQIRVP